MRGFRYSAWMRVRIHNNCIRVQLDNVVNNMYIHAMTRPLDFRCIANSNIMFVTFCILNVNKNKGRLINQRSAYNKKKLNIKFNSSKLIAIKNLYPSNNHIMTQSFLKKSTASTQANPNN